MGNRPRSSSTLNSSKTFGKGKILAPLQPPPRPAGATSSLMGRSSPSPGRLPLSTRCLGHLSWHGWSYFASQNLATSKSSTTGSGVPGCLDVRAQRPLRLLRRALSQANSRCPPRSGSPLLPSCLTTDWARIPEPTRFLNIFFEAPYQHCHLEEVSSSESLATRSSRQTGV